MTTCTSCQRQLPDGKPHDWVECFPTKPCEPLSSIATDTASPHFGHAVLVNENGEGQWICLTCDEDAALDHKIAAFDASLDDLLRAVTQLLADVARARRRFGIKE
jgi:hypothetical protein